MSPNNLFKFLYLAIIIAALLMTVRRMQDAAYMQAIFVIIIGGVCAYRLYRTLQHERT